jgi:hypothetical protein
MPTQEEQALLLALKRRTGNKKGQSMKLLETFSTAVKYLKKKIFFL